MQQYFRCQPAFSSPDGVDAGTSRLHQKATKDSPQHRNAPLLRSTCQSCFDPDPICQNHRAAVLASPALSAISPRAVSSATGPHTSLATLATSVHRSQLHSPELRKDPEEGSFTVGFIASPALIANVPTNGSSWRRCSRSLSRSACCLSHSAMFQRHPIIPAHPHHRHRATCGVRIRRMHGHICLSHHNAITRHRLGLRRLRPRHMPRNDCVKPCRPLGLLRLRRLPLHFLRHHHLHHCALLADRHHSPLTTLPSTYSSCGRPVRLARVPRPRSLPPSSALGRSASSLAWNAAQSAHSASLAAPRPLAQLLPNLRHGRSA